jgi:hypothetical protein
MGCWNSVSSVEENFGTIVELNSVNRVNSPLESYGFRPMSASAAEDLLSAMRQCPS